MGPSGAGGSGMVSPPGPGNGGGGNAGAGGDFTVDFEEPKMPGGTGGLGNDTCAAEMKEATPTPVDLYVLLDRSGSMTKQADLWTPVTEAIKAFVQSPKMSGVGMGLQYFPRNGTKKEQQPICSVENYLVPAVPIAVLPGNAEALKSSIDAHHFTQADWDLPTHWGTPTRFVAAAAVAHLTERATTHPERGAAILLATDGEPAGCNGSGAEDVVKVLEKAAASSPPIRTFVIGIGAINNLNRFAAAGGTGPEAIVVDKEGGEKTRDQFLAALEQIRQATLPCSYAIPDAGDVDPKKVNVSVKTAGDEITDLVKVANAGACATASGPAWHYDDEADPKAVVMCPSSCALLQEGPRKIQLAFGCVTRTVL